MKKQRTAVLVCVGVLVTLVAAFVLFYSLGVLERPRSHKYLQHRRNLQELGLAVSFFTLEHGGRRPKTLAELAPYVDSPLRFLSGWTGETGNLATVDYWAEFILLTNALSIADRSAGASVPFIMLKDRLHHNEMYALFTDGIVRPVEKSSAQNDRMQIGDTVP